LGGLFRVELRCDDGHSHSLLRLRRLNDYSRFIASLDIVRSILRWSVALGFDWTDVGTRLTLGLQLQPCAFFATFHRFFIFGQVDVFPTHFRLSLYSEIFIFPIRDTDLKSLTAVAFRGVVVHFLPSICASLSLIPSES
jgi:hypothetical protein